MNSAKFWSKRASDRIKEVLRYARYMFNDHLLFILIIAIGGGAYYYQGWVKGLTEDFPTALLFAVLFSIILAWGSVITFLLEPDKVYLLPVETQMKPYLRRSAILTFIWHSYILLMILLVVAPIYTKTIEDGSLYQFSGLLLLLKVVNLRVRWNADFDPDKTTIFVDYLIRLLFNGIIIYLIINQSFLLFWITLAIFVLYSAYFEIIVRGKVLPWERLIENEEKRMGRFYRLANLFTDVPKLRNEVKRRKVMDIFMSRIPFASKNTFTYLLIRTFFRSGDYFGLFTRLTIIGVIFIFEFRGSLLGIAIGLLFIYLTGFQLLNLWRHHEALIWTQIYPVDQEIKKRSFLKLLLNILWTENLIFTLVFLTSMQWVNGLICFAILSVFIYLFVYQYSIQRLKKWELQWD